MKPLEFLLAGLKKPLVRAVLLVLCGFLLGRYAGATKSYDWDPSQQYLDVETELKACSNRVEQQDRERKQMREELAYLKQSVVVEQEACNVVREALFDKEKDISKLNEQLAFYQGIVSPEGRSGGVRIFKFELDSIGDRDLQYRVTLLQSVRQDQAAKGKIKVQIVGLNAQNETESLNLSDLVGSDDFVSSYEFRYYTELYGNFRLPRQWTPLRVEVEVVPRGKTKPTATQTYVWNELIVAPGADESIE